MWSIYLVLFAWLSVCRLHTPAYPEKKRQSYAVLIEFEWNGLKVSEVKFLEAIASHLNLWNLTNLVVLNLSLFRATRGFKPFQDSLWCLNFVCCFDGLWIVYLSVCLFSWRFVSFCLLVKVINLLFISVHVNAWHGLWIIVTHSPTCWQVGEWQRVVVPCSTLEVLARHRQRCANAGSVLLAMTDIGTAVAILWYHWCFYITLTCCQRCPNAGSVPLARDDTDTALAVIASLLLVIRLQRWPNIKLTLTTHENYKIKNKNILSK